MTDAPLGWNWKPLAGRALEAALNRMLALDPDAQAGLRARGHGEEIELAPLVESVATGRVQADHWLERFHGEWQGDLNRIYAEAAY